MIDIKRQTEDLIERAELWEKQDIIDHYASVLDWLIYYEDDIIRWLTDEGIEAKQITHLLDESNLVNWEDLFSWSYQLSSPRGLFSIISIQEIEIDISHEFATHKQSVRDVVNNYTDLYIADNGLAYITSDLVLCLDIDKIKTYLEDNE